MRLDLERYGTWHMAHGMPTWNFSKCVGGNLIYLSLFLSNYLLVFTPACVCPLPKELGCNRLSFPILFWSNLMQTKRCFCLLFTFHIHSTIQNVWLLPGLGFFPIFAAIIHFVYCLHFLAISRTLNNKETIHSFELFLLIFLIFIAYSTVFIVINTTVTRFDIYYCCHSNLLLLKFFRIGCSSYCNAVVRSKL